MELSQEVVINDKILKLVYYFDNFDYPIKVSEIESLLRYSKFTIRTNIEKLEEEHILECFDGYVFTPGKRWTIARREKLMRNFLANMDKILRAGKILSHIPFVRGIFLTGSTSKGIYDKFQDLDFFIITKPNRVWICNILIILFNKIISKNYRNFNFKSFCCNYLISEENLRIADQNEFTALEIYYSKPIFNRVLHHKFLQANSWIKRFFRVPNHQKIITVADRRISWIQTGFEFIFNLLISTIFPSNLLEKRLYTFYYYNQKKQGFCKDPESFYEQYSLQSVKPPLNSQRFLLQKLQEIDGEKYRNEIRTLAKRKELKLHYRDHVKSVDILLTHAYYLSKTRSEKKIMKPYVPLGPLWVASFLKQHGLKVAFVDTTFMPGPSTFVKNLQKFHTSIIGIYVLEHTRLNAIKMIEICRHLGYVVIVGGPDPSNIPQFYIDHGAHIVVVGEGELTLLEVMKELKSPTKPFTEIAGIYTDAGYNKQRNYITNIDILPPPARELVDFTPYFRIWRNHHKFTSMLLNTSRGCPYSCSWCSKPVFGSKFRQRSPKQVVEEIESLIKTFHPEKLWFTDDIFFINPNWLIEFHSEMVKKPIFIPFECLLRVDLINPKSLRLLKECGCYRIWYGAESGSQRILNRMRKKFTVPQIICASKLTKMEGIEVGFFIMLGYPGEKISDIELTRKLVRLTRPNHCGVAIAYPFEGTTFYTEVAHILLPSRSKYRLENTNKLSYKAPYPQIFYRVTKILLEREAELQRDPHLGVRKRIFYNLYRIIYGFFKKCYT